MTSPAESSTSLPDEAFQPGAVFVHRDMHYIFQLRTEGGDASTLVFEGVGEYRRLTLPRSEARLELRLPIDVAQADELARLITHAEPVLPDRDLDLLLYLRGTREQAAVAIATLMDRSASPDHLDPASDLRFQRLKLLGELAWVQGRGADMFRRAESPGLSAFVETLRARRRAVPPNERRLRVPPPHVPVVPQFVLDPDLVDEAGWHVIEARLCGETGWFAATLGELEVREELGAASELTLSTFHRDGRIRWMVLSECGPARIESSDGVVLATCDGERVVLQRRSRHEGQTLLVAQSDYPSDLMESLEVRLRYPRGQLLVWKFGLAAIPAMDFWELFTGRTARGGTVWAFACGDDADES